MISHGTSPSASQGTAPRRITFVVPSLHGGGAEFVARTWMTWLSSQGHDVSVVTTSGKLTHEYVPAGTTPYSVAEASGQIGKVRALASLLEKLAPDIAISLQAHANLVLITAARLLGSKRPPVIISERNLVSLGLEGASRNHKLKIFSAKRMYRFADHVIAISHPVAGELVSGFGVSGSRITVVPNPATAKVDRSKFVTRVAGIEHGVQLVLPCRLVVQKRPHLAIDTAKELSDRGITAEVISFGGGPLEQKLIDRAAKLGVKFTSMGWVENWFEHFAPNSVVLLPSDREGFGNVLVEAAAARVPSVAVSGALGVADAVVPGITGELALTADPRDLADAVIRASALDVTGIDSWLRRFSPESSGEDLLRVIEITIDRAANRVGGTRGAVRAESVA